MAPQPPESGDPRQPSYEALAALLAAATGAANNPANLPEAQDVAFALCNVTQAQLDALNLAVFTGNTVQLKAAEAQMTPEMADLKKLQSQIAALGKAMKEGETIVAGIDQVLGAIKMLS